MTGKGPAGDKRTTPEKGGHQQLAINNHTCSLSPSVFPLPNKAAVLTRRLVIVHP
jgi:hypothetical protein